MDGLRNLLKAVVSPLALTTFTNYFLSFFLSFFFFLAFFADGKAQQQPS